MKTTIPCIKNSCLKYPVCKTKNTIKCDLLNEYIISKIMEMKRLRQYNDGEHLKWWIKNLNPYLPNLTYVDNEPHNKGMSHGQISPMYER